jgi:hypothetical protein
VLIERRQYERYHLPLPVVVEFHGAGRRHHERTQLRDIAIGGAALPIAAPVELGSELDLTLFDNKNHLARALGLTVPAGLALRFSVNGRVIRRIHAPAGSEPRQYAVQFISPLRITQSAGAAI